MKYYLSESATDRIGLLDIFVDPIPSSRHCRQYALWRAVILQALLDAASHSNKAQQIFDKREAYDWLTGFSTDFIVVCDLAGLNPQDVRRKAKRALMRRCTWRKKPTKKKKSSRKKPARKEPERRAEKLALPLEKAV